MPRKYTIEDARTAFAAVGNELLEEEYINDKTVMRYRCKCGRTQPEIKPKNLFRIINGCYHCHICGYEKMKTSQKMDFSIIKNSFASINYKLITRQKDYVNSLQKLWFVCNNEHRHYITWKNFQRGNRCNICKITQDIQRLDYYHKQREYGFDAIKIWIESLGYDLITTKREYKNTNISIQYKCPQCNKICLSRIQHLKNPNKIGCSSCGGKAGYNFRNMPIIRSEEDFIRDLERLSNDNPPLQTSPKRGQSRRKNLQ